jgi:uncharacterized protein YidB (DUF937 family)
MDPFDSILHSVLSGLNNNQQSGLMDAVSGLLTQGGGIKGLMQKFGAHGLGDLVKGWVSTGPNPPATPAHTSSRHRGRSNCMKWRRGPA